MRSPVAAFRWRIGFRHVLHHHVAWLEATDEKRALIADHGRDPIVFTQGIGGSAGTGLLPQAEVHTADDFALLIEVLESLFHLAIEYHPAIDLDALLFAEVLRVTDGRGGSAKVTRDFITTLVALANLADNETRLLKPEIGNRIGAFLGERRCTGTGS